LRKQLDQQTGLILIDAFSFAGRRYARMTPEVMKRLGLFQPSPGTFLISGSSNDRQWFNAWGSIMRFVHTLTT
jgi:hypothetical protein